MNVNRKIGKIGKIKMDMLQFGTQVLGILNLGNSLLVDFIRAVGDAEGARTDVSAGKNKVVGHASGAMRLNSTINDTAGHIGSHDLNHGDQIAG
jgi:hypothetical protein